jgi:polyisoprenoid-binding protein YceI
MKTNAIRSKRVRKPKVQVAHTKTASIPSPQSQLNPQWELDKYNSSIEFSTMHFNVVNIGGRFNNFDIKIFSDRDDLEGAIIELIIHTESLDTGNAQRDAVLKGEEWLDVKRFPAINFNSTSFKKMGDNKYEISGNISIHGVSHPVTFNATLNGEYCDTYPKRTIAGFTLSGIFDRTKFNIGGFPAATGVGLEVSLGANIEIVRNVLSS